MRLINLDKLLQIPIRINHFDEDNGSEEFIGGIETALEYAQGLELVDAIPVGFIRKQMERYDKEARKYSEENKSMLAICEIDKYNALKHIIDDWQKESGEWEEYIKGTL